MSGAMWFPGGARVALFVALLGVLYAAYLVLRPVILIVVFAAAIASLTVGMHRWVVRRLRGRQRLAAALTVLVLLLGVFGPLATLGTFAVARLVGEIEEVAADIREEGSGSTTHEISRRFGRLGPHLERSVAKFRPQVAAAMPDVARRAGQLFSSLGRGLLRAGIALFLFAVTLYYFYLNGAAWGDRLVRVLPLWSEDVRLFIQRFRQVSAAVLVGNIGTALAQGGAATIGYVAIAVPLPLIWGAVTTVAALFPVIGTWIVWVPLAVYMTIAQGWLRGVLLAAFGVAVISSIDNVVRPLLTRRGLQLHSLLVFLAVFGGVASFGFAGIFIGPLVMALAITMLDVYEYRSHKAEVK